MTILYSHFREHSVYPGHPITLALEIMLAYDRDLDKALAPCINQRTGESLGFCDAVGNSEISGAGGNAYTAADLVRRLKDKKPIGETIAWGMKQWENQTKIGGNHRKEFEAGQEQAERMVWPLLDQIYRAMAEGKL